MLCLPSYEAQRIDTVSQVYLGNVEDSTDLAHYFYDQPSTYSTRNPYIIPDEDKNPLRILSIAEMENVSGVICQGQEDAAHESSIWLIVDVLNSNAAEMLKAASGLLVCESLIYHLASLHLVRRRIPRRECVSFTILVQMTPQLQKKTISMPLN